MKFWNSFFKRLYGSPISSAGKTRGSFVDGIKKDVFDSRDYKVKTVLFEQSIPESYSLKNFVKQVKNQGSIGSCGAHAYTTALEVLFSMRNDAVELSELFHYYVTREIEGTVLLDDGMELRNGAKALAEQGVCFETQHAYHPLLFDVEPTNLARITAQWLTIKEYRRVNSFEEIKQSIAQGLPVVIGVRVDNKFFADKTGDIKRLSDTLLGGHAVCAVGYDKDRIEIVNSWSQSWGNSGFAWLNKTFVDKALIDAWVVIPRWL